MPYAAQGTSLLAQDFVEGGTKLLAEIVGARAGVARSDDSEHLGTGRGRYRVCVVGSLVANLLAPVGRGNLEVEAVEQILAPGQRPSRQAAGEDLGERAEIGGNPELALRAARRYPEPRHYLVEDEEHPVLAGRLAQRFEE